MQRMKKWNNFMMILKEQWPIVPENIKSLEQKKTSKACEHLEWRTEKKEEIA